MQRAMQGNRGWGWSWSWMLTLGLLGSSALAAAPGPSADGGAVRKFTVQGKPLTVKVQVLEPPVRFQGTKEAADRHTALGCAQQLYSLLAAGDLDGAAALSDDPARLKANYGRLLERLGPEEFKRTYAAFLGPAGLELRVVFTLGTHALLVVRNPEMGMDAAQFYSSTGGVFHAEDRKSPEREQLGRLFQQLKNDDGVVVLP